jgi:hypothetical protein
LTSIGGATGVQNLAEVDQDSGLATSWNPLPDGAVNSIEWRRRAIRDTANSAQQLPTVLVTGTFTKIGMPGPDGQQPLRNRAAELGASDGGFATPWNPTLSSASQTSGAGYDILPINTFDSIVGGAFLKVGTSDRSRLAETDRTTGAALDWDPSLDAATLDLDYGPLATLPNDGSLTGPPLIAAAGLMGTGTPPYSRRLIAFYCRIDLPVSC